MVRHTAGSAAPPAYTLCIPLGPLTSSRSSSARSALPCQAWSPALAASAAEEGGECWPGDVPCRSLFLSPVIEAKNLERDQAAKLDFYLVSSDGFTLCS